VVAQATPAGAIVPVGERIGLTAFPPGGIRVPRVAGLTVEDATRLVSQAGLTPRVSPLGNAPSQQQANRVDGSQPAENETAEPGAIVALLAFGPYRAPALPGDRQPVAAAGVWGQPWRGEIKLTLIVADGETMNLAAALARYLKPKPAKPAESASGGGILAVPGAIASSGVDAIGEAVAETIGVVFKALDLGMPISIVLAEEQGGFRLRVPGSSKFVDAMNASLAQFVPLLLPQGGTLLRASKTTSGADIGEATATFELTAAPDWQQITIKVSIKASNLKMDAGPRSLELALVGTAKPGLYSAESYEDAVMALVGSLMPP
jgi:hypothetical protein